MQLRFKLTNPDSDSTSADRMYCTDSRSVDRPTVGYYRSTTDDLNNLRLETVGISELLTDGRSDFLPTYQYC